MSAFPPVQGGQGVVIRCDPTRKVRENNGRSDALICAGPFFPVAVINSRTILTCAWHSFQNGIQSRATRSVRRRKVRCIHSVAEGGIERSARLFPCCGKSDVSLISSENQTRRVHLRSHRSPLLPKSDSFAGPLCPLSCLFQSDLEISFKKKKSI